jgi:hypothetical protein
MFNTIRKTSTKSQTSLNRTFISYEGKKSKIYELLCEILFNKYVTLKRRKNEVMDFVKKKLNNAIVNNELKSSIEKEAFNLFAVAPDKKDIPKVAIKQIYNNEQFLNTSSRISN